MEADESCRPTILVLHPGALGDVLLSLRALRSLRRRFPSHQLTLIAREDIGRVLKQGGEIDECMSFDRVAVAELLGGLDLTDHGLRETLARCTHAVFWMADHHGIVRENLYRYGVTNCIAVSIQRHEVKHVHASERYVESLAPWNVRPVSIDRPLTLASDGRGSGVRDAWMNKAVESGAPIFAVHPGSGSPDKCCPADLLATAVLDVHERRNCRIVVCRGPADKAYVDRFKEALDMTPYVMAGPEPLAEMAHLLARVDLFLGHDSGLTHLAALLGVPTLAIFGPTRPEEWAPEGDHVLVLSGGACTCVGWAEIQRCQEKPCLRVSPSHVVEAVEALVSAESLGIAKARLPSRKDVC